MSSAPGAPLWRVVAPARPTCVAFVVALALIGSALEAPGAPVGVINLITDDQSAHAALLTDPNLINAWGVSSSANGPLWVSAADTSRSMIYGIDPDTNVPTKAGFEVSVPGNPTGQVFNDDATAFNGNASIFVSEDGSISGWRGALGTTAEVLRACPPGTRRSTCRPSATRSM